jgi:hypothetical protein
MINFEIVAVMYKDKRILSGMSMTAMYGCTCTCIINYKRLYRGILSGMSMTAMYGCTCTCIINYKRLYRGILSGMSMTAMYVYMYMYMSVISERIPL